ncbi:MAG: hypothetical protein AAB636_01950 [Patescibacteria group bacterium]
MKKRMLVVFPVLLLFPTLVLAAGEYVYDISLISEKAELILEPINLLIAILAAVFAVKLAALSQGGELEKTWNMIAIVAVIFAILEAYGTLKGLMLVHVGGLGDILELIFGLILLYTVYKTRKTLLQKMLGK